MSEKILVLGSNSFSGAHFIANALEQGFEVAGISRSAEPDAVFLPYRPAQPGRFQFHRMDINRDLQKIEEFIDQFRPAFVVNFAAQGMVAESWNDPLQWYETNFTSAVRLHEVLRRCAFLKKFVQISTPEVYGSCPDPVTEEAPLRPTTPYAVSKAACDMSLYAFHLRYGFPVVFTRAANVYGPGQQPYRIIPKAVITIMKGGRLPLHGAGRSVRSFIYIDDAMDATLRVMKRGHDGHVYHVATQRMVSVAELVKLICEKLDVEYEAHVTTVPERPGKDMFYSLDSSRARAELDWTDRTSLEAGIERTIEWVRQNFPVLSRLPLEYEHKH